MISLIDLLLDLALSDVSRTRSWPSWQIVTFGVSYEAPSSKVDKLMYSHLCIFSSTFVGMGGMPSTIMEVGSFIGTGCSPSLSGGSSGWGNVGELVLKWGSTGSVGMLSEEDPRVRESMW